ncbi:hypothetical protein [Bradyrhizobium yuanmingense]|nr:hypothetical protein [Bradyrhizobium yuanmingense]
MSDVETSEDRPLHEIQRDRNPGDIVLEPEPWVDDVTVDDDEQ